MIYKEILNNFILHIDKNKTLFEYVLSKDFEYAKVGNRVIVNTSNESVSLQFAKESGKY